jgi:hypothetical protein
MPISASIARFGVVGPASPQRLARRSAYDRARRVSRLPDYMAVLLLLQMMMMMIDDDV